MSQKKWKSSASTPLNITCRKSACPKNHGSNDNANKICGLIHYHNTRVEDNEDKSDNVKFSGILLIEKIIREIENINYRSKCGLGWAWNTPDRALDRSGAGPALGGHINS